MFGASVSADVARGDWRNRAQAPPLSLALELDDSDTGVHGDASRAPLGRCPGTPGENYDGAIAHPKAAEILRARFLHVNAGGRSGTRTDEQFDHIEARYREYAAWACDHGFKVGADEGARI